MLRVSHISDWVRRGCQRWAALTFIWVASCHATPAVPQPTLPTLAQRATCPEGFDAATLQAGQKVYLRVCMACHQGVGQGLKGVFPPLAGHAPRLAQTAAGRSYLTSLVLWGMSGPIAVDGAAYQNLMPPQQAILQDAEVAAVLTYVMHAWGNCRSFSAAPHFDAADVALQRSASRSADAIYEQRRVTGF